MTRHTGPTLNARQLARRLARLALITLALCTACAVSSSRRTLKPEAGDRQTSDRQASDRQATEASPMPRDCIGRVQRGKASWYGKRHHGRKTASGERFNKNALTAAHRTLKFGTVVKVTNQRNGRSVEVRINDRGPFGRRGRIIDLSEEAARQLRMRKRGVAPVELCRVE